MEAMSPFDRSTRLYQQQPSLLLKSARLRMLFRIFSMQLTVWNTSH